MGEGGPLAQAAPRTPGAREWMALGLSRPLVHGDNGLCVGVAQSALPPTPPLPWTSVLGKRRGRRNLRTWGRYVGRG